MFTHRRHHQTNRHRSAVGIRLFDVRHRYRGRRDGVPHLRHGNSGRIRHIGKGRARMIGVVVAAALVVCALALMLALRAVIITAQHEWFAIGGG